MRTRQIVLGIVALLGCTMVACGQAPAVKVPSAYDKLDPTLLSDALSQQGQASLLNRLEAQLRDNKQTADADYAACEALVCQARGLLQNAPDKPEAFYQLIDQAIGKLQNTLVNVSVSAAPEKPPGVAKLEADLKDKIATAKENPDELAKVAQWALDNNMPNRALEQAQNALLRQKNHAGALAVQSMANRRILKSFRFRMRLADLIGNVAIEPVVDNVNYLQATDQELVLIAKQTGKAPKMFETLRQNLRDSLDKLSAVDRVALAPEFEELQKAVLFKMSRAAYFRAVSLPMAAAIEREAMRSLAEEALRDPKADPNLLAMAKIVRKEATTQPDTTEHSTLVTMADAVIQKATGQPPAAQNDKLVSFAKKVLFVQQAPAERGKLLTSSVSVLKELTADASDESGLRPGALLYLGQVQREVGGANYMLAIETLKGVTGADIDPDIRKQALFAICRCYIEKGDFENAQKQVDEFRTAAKGIIGEVPADVQYAFIKNYMFTRWAASLRADKKEAEAAQKDIDAQNALLQFASDHPAQQKPFFEMLAQKFAGRDYQTLPSLIVVAMAVKERESTKADTPEREKANKRCEDMLKTVLKRDTAADKTAWPLSLWTLGLIYNDQGKNDDSSKMFDRLSSEFPKDNLAFEAKRNSIIQLQTIVEVTSKKEMTPDVQTSLAGFQDQLVVALEAMFANADWAKNPKAQAYRFVLAGLYEIKANAVPADQKPPLLKKALANFELVPPTEPEHMEARNEALKDRVELIELITDKDKDKAKAQQKAQAQEIVPLLEKYVEDAQKAAKNAQDAAAAAKAAGDSSKEAVKNKEASELKTWGGMSDLAAATLYHDYFDKKDQADKIVLAIPAKWEGTPAVREAAKSQILWALFDGKIKEAIDLVNSFAQKYPEQAPALIALMISHLEKAIIHLQGDSSQKELLNKYRSAYGDFAEKLFLEKQKTLSPAELIAFKQLYGRAMIEKGNAASGADAKAAYDLSLKLFTECKAFDDANRDAASKKIDQKYDPKIKAVKEAQGRDAILRLAAEFLDKDLAPTGLSVKDLLQAESLEKIYKAVKADAKAPKKDIDLLQNATWKAYDALVKRIKKDLNVNQDNLWGLARSQRARKEYDKALEYYGLLCNGLDKNGPTTKELYWQAQLEFCLTAMEAAPTAKEPKKAYGGILLRINGLKFDNPAMGGRASEFNAIRSEAEQKSK